MKLKIIVHMADEGGFWAEVPALPGCVSQGETLDETIANTREAVEAWLDVSQEEHSPDGDVQLLEIDL